MRRKIEREAEQELVAAVEPPDVCAAWRRTITPSAAPFGLRDPEIGVTAAALGTLLSRLSYLEPKHRPEHAVASRVVWRSSAALINDSDFEARALGWRIDDPDPALVQRLLDILQSIETAGWVELSEAGLRSLLRLLPSLKYTADARPIYVLANRGRALRFLGRHDDARVAYENARESARRLGEEWLEYRCELGLAVVAEERGNFPAARAAYRRVLDRYGDGSPISRAARQGLLSVARITKRYDEAFDHAWHAFREAGRDRTQRIDALTQLGELCRRVGRFQAALRACEAALALQPPVRYIAPLHGTAMRAAESLGLFAKADEYAAIVMKLLPEASYDAYARADVWRDLAWWHAAREEVLGGRREEARQCASEARALASQHAFNEMIFEMDDLIAHLDGAQSKPSMPSPLGTAAEQIVTDVAALPLAGELLLAIG